METKIQRIIDKAFELVQLTDRDEMIYGNSYIEIGEGFIKRLDPIKVIITNKNKNIIHTKLMKGG